MSESLSKCAHCLGKKTTFVVEGGYSQLNTGNFNEIIDCPFCCVIEINTDDLDEELKEEFKKRGRKPKKVECVIIPIEKKLN